MALSRSELAKLASDAGFTGDNVNIAAAVALAESGGNPRAYNGKGADRSYGLMQINMIGAMGPDRRKTYGLKSNDDLFDPKTNMRVAYGIYKGSGWKAWTTYTRGTYKQYLDADAPSILPATAEAPGRIDPVLGVGDAINAFGKTLFNGIANISGVVIAAVFIVLGVVLLSRNIIPVGKVAKTIKKVTK
jgi:hypothetical protein